MKHSKKLLFLLLPGILFVSCNKQETATPQPTDTKTTQTENKTTETKTGNTLSSYFANGDITFSTPKQIDILTQQDKDEILKIANKNVEPQYASNWSSLGEFLNFYEIGKINNGIYKDQKLILFEQECDGPCFVEEIDRFAYDEKNHKLTMLTKHSAKDNSEYVSVFADKIDRTTALKGLNPPEKIKLPDSDKYVEIETKDLYLNIGENSDQTEYNSNFEDAELGTVYFNKLQKDESMTFGCFYLKSPDGTTTKYRYNPELINENSWINWQNGDKATNLSDNYSYNDSGCGMGGMCYTIEKVDPENLVLVGKSSSGIDLYESKNPQNDELVKSFHETASKFADKKMTFDEYLKIHPVLFWKDPLDRWSIIINNTIKPPAECGKPVIYLYPQNEMDVNVKVGIDRITESIPAYSHEGWAVHAYPNGRLYNYSDNQTYPYLYWEGQSYGQNSANKGFVVKRTELDDFFNKSLAKLGLNSTEISDFKDFWLSRMLDNKDPYFFISFIGTKDFNKIAPLSISPVPDTLLRVFMYYQPLKNTVKVQSQELTGKERKGFSVVEWGGTSNVPWRK